MLTRKRNLVILVLVCVVLSATNVLFNHGRLLTCTCRADCQASELSNNSYRNTSPHPQSIPNSIASSINNVASKASSQHGDVNNVSSKASSQQGDVNNVPSTARASTQKQSTGKNVSLNRLTASPKQSISKNSPVAVLFGNESHQQANSTWSKPDSVHVISQQQKVSYINYTSTLTRLGSDVDFVLALCPRGSTMIPPFPKSPLHKDCPRLFIVGARKGGSTSLLQYISGHPDFEGGCLKCQHVGETFYFSNYYQQSWEWYLNKFPRDVLMTGESSVGYLVDCNAARRILMNCGKQAKIVMLFRNPIDRFVSNFLMRVRGTSNYGFSPGLTTSTSIHDVVSKEVRQYIYKTAKPPTGNTASVRIAEVQRTWFLHKCKIPPGHSMISDGLYYVHLMYWLCNFPADNILIVNSEEFFIDKVKIMKQLVGFLGLKDLRDEEYINITSMVHNAGNYDEVPPHQQLSQSDRKILHDVFRPFNEALMDLLHWNNVSWN